MVIQRIVYLFHVFILLLFRSSIISGCIIASDVQRIVHLRNCLLAQTPSIVHAPVQLAALMGFAGWTMGKAIQIRHLFIRWLMPSIVVNEETIESTHEVLQKSSGETMNMKLWIRKFTITEKMTWPILNRRVSNGERGQGTIAPIPLGVNIEK